MRKLLVVLFILGSLSILALAWLGTAYERDIALPAGVPGKHVAVDGVELRYLQQGEGRDVLLVHGAMGSVEDWEALIPLLAKRYRVTAFDRIGHGFSASSPPHDLTGNARFTRGLIDALALRDVIVVGHSYGGAVALKLALEHEPRIGAYVLLAPASQPGFDPPLMDRAFAFPVLGLGLVRVAAPLLANRLIREGLEAAVSPDRSRVPRDFFETRARLWNEPGILLAQSQQRVRFAREVTTMSAGYKLIKEPVEILQGDRDAFSRLIDHSRKLARALPQGHLVELHRVGHYIQYADPQAVVDAVDRAARASEATDPGGGLEPR